MEDLQPLRATAAVDMKPSGRLLLCWLLLLLAPSPAPAAASAVGRFRQPLPVLWMMPSGSGEENLTASVAPAVQLALHDLQERAAPLGGYRLQLQLLDSQCDTASRLKALFEAMWAGPKFLLLLGGVCPSGVAAVARALPALHLVQVSFAAASPALANRKWYGNLFSTVPSDRAVNQAAVKLLQRFRWSRVGLLTQEGERLSEMNRDLSRQLLKAEVELVATEILDRTCSGLRKLKERDVRIFVGQLEEEEAAAGHLFCCAYRLNLFGARYQWILAGGGVASREAEPQDSGCGSAHLRAAAEASLRLRIRTLDGSRAPGVSGRTPEDYQDAYLTKLKQEGAKFSPLHAFAYDAVWVAAKALSQAMESLRRGGGGGQEEAERSLLEAMRRTRLQGVTGPISFRNGERMTSVQLLQIQEGTGVLVGDFNSSTQQLRLTNHLLKFKGPGAPRDRRQVHLLRHRLGLLPLAVMSSAAVAVFSAALCFLLYILVRRDLWYEAAERRSLQDEALLLGLLLSSSSVLISGPDEAWLPDAALRPLCSVHLWILSAGQALSLSVLLAKAWSLYSLRGARKLQPAGGVLLGLLLLDLLLLASWQMADPLGRVEVQHSSQSGQEQDVLVLSSWRRCSSRRKELWLTALWMHRGPLLGLGCFLAWNVRGARAAGGRRLAGCLLAAALSAVTGAWASPLLSHHPPALFCLSGSLVLCCDACVLGWLFGAKFLQLWQNGGVRHDQELAEGARAPERVEEAEGAEGAEGTRRLQELNRRLRIRAAELQCEEEETVGLLLAALPRHPHGNEGEESGAHACDTDLDKHSDINSPELVRRRLSVQLPILHHSYLPAVGGVSSSSSGGSDVFGSRDALVNGEGPRSL